MKIQANLYKDGKPFALTMSYDDGQIHDRRLIEIFNKHGIRGTFHLNGGTVGKNKFVTAEEIPELYNGHEVAAHTLTHPMMDQLPDAELIHEILEDRRILEAAAGYPIRGMAYPSGRYNDKVIEVLRTLGIVYARNSRSSNNFSRPDNFMVWTMTCRHREQPTEKLRTMLERKVPGSLLFVMGHSYEFERDGNWEIIEEFCSEAGGRDNIWYATCIELYEYITAQKSIVLSADRTMAYNPSAVSVWLTVNNEPVECKPGAVTKF